MSAALELGDSVGKAVACRALGVPRASLYRRMQPSAPRRVRSIVIPSKLVVEFKLVRQFHANLRFKCQLWNS